MKKHKPCRNCLVGDLGHEVAILPASLRQIIIGVCNHWRFIRISCPRRAQETGEIALDFVCDTLISAFGLDGRVLHCVLSLSAVQRQ